MQKLTQKLFLIGLTFLMAACATKTAAPVVDEEPIQDPTESMVKYSNEPNHAPVADRDYRPMTRQRMEEESGLHAGAGSLWVMEGQTSYLFAQNKQRKSGDPTQIKIEGAAFKQLELKVSTVQNLLGQLEEQRLQAEADRLRLEEDSKKMEADKKRLAAIEDEKEKIKAANTSGQSVGPAEIQKLAEENVNKRMPAEVKPLVSKTEPIKKVGADEKVDLKDVEFIPSRIVEKLSDGYYRVAGQQIMSIKKRPYKVIATGLVRIEDFDDQSLSSNKLLDAQFDIVHIKKAEKF